MPQTANNIAAQSYQGLNISWGLGANDLVITGVGMVVQSNDTEIKYDEMEVRDQRGNVVAWVGYNPTDSATMEYVVTASGAAAGTAAISYPSQGSKITVGGNSDEPISGSNWIVQSVTLRRSNTDATKVSLKMIRYKGIV